MLKLTDRKWEAFKIEDVFELSTGANYSKKSLRSGLMPRITATGQNNGVDYFTADIDDQEVKEYKNFRRNKNCISVSFLGSVFYHPYEASYDMKIHSLNSNKINKYTGLFVASECHRQFEKTTYGNQLSKEDLRTKHLLLPVASHNVPDWDFMESYMRQVERELLAIALPALNKQLRDSEQNGGGEKLQCTKWKVFDFTDVFSKIQRGKRLKKADHKEGITPYISSTSFTNGVDGFVGNNSSVRIFYNCLTLANSGSVGCAFYHKYKFVASDHVTQLKRDGLDKYTYLFLAPIVQRLSEKYSFNREINDERIKREKLLLPATETGEIDFAFMSSFMKSVEKDILKTTIETFNQLVEQIKICTQEG